MSVDLEQLRMDVARLSTELLQLQAERQAAIAFEFQGGHERGAILRDEYSMVQAIAASFWPTINAARTGIVIEEGDVMLGALAWVEWASITAATTTPAVSATDTHVWLEINVVTPAATMVVGSKAAMKAALDSTEDDSTMVYPLIGTTWADGKITKAKRLLDAIIPRASG